MRSLRIVVVLIATMAVARTGLTKDLWPGWLGPARNGSVPGVSLPTPLPKSLDKAWSVEVGTGYGSPLLIDNRIFLHSRAGDEEVVRCLQRDDGSVLWEKRYAVPFQPGGGGEWHGRGPKSTPVWANGRLFTMSILGDLSAWNAEDGRLLWRSDFDKRFEPNRPYWGVSTSPLIAGDLVIAHFGNDESGTLAAFDGATGKVAWTSGSAGTSYSSPVLATIDSIPQIIEWNHEELTGIDVQSGQQLWSVSFPHESHNQNMPTPVVYNGLVLLGAENRGLHGYRPIRSGSSWSVDKVWDNPSVALDMSTAVIASDLLFGLSHYGKGRLFCANPATGEIHWQSPGRVAQHTNMLSVGKHLLVLTHKGSLQVLPATSERHEVVASWDVSERPTWAPPVLLRDGVLIRDQTHLNLLKF
jgi:outer membrane protein assembly factor BamB